jgi:activating signal cointegrator complex subunit 1
LRCLIIHAPYRQPKSKTVEPISYAELVESAAFQAISADQPPLSSETSTITGPRSVDFGVWDVDEIQICKFATEGPEGENVACGGIKIKA